MMPRALSRRKLLRLDRDLGATAKIPDDHALGCDHRRELLIRIPEFFELGPQHLLARAKLAKAGLQGLMLLQRHRRGAATQRSENGQDENAHGTRVVTAPPIPSPLPRNASQHPHGRGPQPVA